jgi:hypothetical protein
MGQNLDRVGAIPVLWSLISIDLNARAVIGATQICCSASRPPGCDRAPLYVERGATTVVEPLLYSPDYGTLYLAAVACQTTCPANTVYVQLCLESAQYGRMCRAWPLPYGDGQVFVAQYDHMPAGEYTLHVRY